MEEQDEFNTKLKFPKALTNEEQKMYMEIFYKNNDRKSPEALKAREKLVLHFLRLVQSITNKYPVSNKEYLDELFDFGVYWMIRAIDAYNIEKGYALSTYIYTAVRRGIAKSLSYQKTHAIDALSFETTYLDKGKDEDLSLQDITADPDDIIEKTNQKLENEEFLKKLDTTLHRHFPERQIDMLYRHLGIMGREKQSFKEIQEAFGYKSSSYISKIFSNQYDVIKKELFSDRQSLEKVPNKTQSEKLIEAVKQKLTNEKAKEQLDTMLHSHFPEDQIDMLYRFFGIMGREKQSIPKISEAYSLKYPHYSHKLIIAQYDVIKTEFLADEKTLEEKPKHKQAERTL